MQARILELAHQGFDDAEIANTLTQEGHRSPRRNYVPVRTVQIVRQRHRVLQNAVATRARHIAGSLPVTAMAKRLGVSSSWIKQRIRVASSTSSAIPGTSDSFFLIQKPALLRCASLRQELEIISFSTREQTNEGINMTDRKAARHPQ
ncbi:hypothetical protein [Bradyrhizobium sp. LeoA1S1]